MLIHAVLVFLFPKSTCHVKCLPINIPLMGRCGSGRIAEEKNNIIRWERLVLSNNAHSGTFIVALIAYG